MPQRRFLVSTGRAPRYSIGDFDIYLGRVFGQSTADYVVSLEEALV
jgi:hypothetical protein